MAIKHQVAVFHFKVPNKTIPHLPITELVPQSRNNLVSVLTGLIIEIDFWHQPRTDL